MSQGFVESVSAADVVERFDTQGHDGESIREPLTALDPILHPSSSEQASGLVSTRTVPAFRGARTNRLHGQGGISRKALRPRRASARSMPLRAKINAMPRVVSTAMNAPARISLR